MVMVSGKSDKLSKLDRQGRDRYAISYTGNMDKRSLVLAENVRALKRLGFEIVPHWNYPDSTDYYAAYGISFQLYSDYQFKPEVSNEVKVFLGANNNQDFLQFLNQEEYFGNV